MAVTGIALAVAPAAAECKAGANGCSPTLTSKRALPIWSVPLIGPSAETNRIVVEGHGRGRDFQPTVARVPEPASNEPPPSLAIDQPLLPGFSSKLFGHEERASFEVEANRLIFRCRPGDAPAGLVFSGRLSQGADLKILIASSGMPGAMAGLSSPDREPHELQSLNAGVTELRPGEAAKENGFALTLLCPLQGGEMIIDDMRLKAANPTRKVDARAAWAWNAALWREKPEFLLARAAELQVGRLFVSLEIDAEKGVLDAERFAGFVEKAHSAGIAIVVVEGDAGMALERGRQLALVRLAAIRRYQLDAEPTARIDGLQYDIEPYLLPDFLTDPEMVMRGWADTIRALRTATALDLEMVLPFWLRSDAHARSHVLPALQQAASGIAIMAYRTDRQQIVEAASPLLAWAGEAGLRTRVALENGPLEDEVTQTFFRAEKGKLTIETSADGRMHATLLDRPAPSGKATFAFSHETVSPASAVSFLGQADRFLESAGRTQEALKAWPAFSGMALHGIIE